MPHFQAGSKACFLQDPNGLPAYIFPLLPDPLPHIRQYATKDIESWFYLCLWSSSPQNLQLEEPPRLFRSSQLSCNILGRRQCAKSTPQHSWARLSAPTKHAELAGQASLQRVLVGHQKCRSIPGAGHLRVERRLNLRGGISSGTTGRQLGLHCIDLLALLP